MESFIAERLRFIRNIPNVNKPLAGAEGITEALTDFESGRGYNLTEEQREAVYTSPRNRLTLILGGAGVGKTAVLNALYAVLEAQEPFFKVYQMALSGKAAMRMSEATARNSSTIAAFLHNVAPGAIADDAWIVIDEASMVDVQVFYRLLRHIPQTCRLILMGDNFQLPPIGPRLVLHALVGTDPSDDAPPG